MESAVSARQRAGSAYADSGEASVAAREEEWVIIGCEREEAELAYGGRGGATAERFVTESFRFSSVALVA